MLFQLLVVQQLMLEFALFVSRTSGHSICGAFAIYVVQDLKFFHNGVAQRLLSFLGFKTLSFNGVGQCLL